MSATTFYNSTNLVGIGTLNAASVSTTLANVIQANIQSMNVSGDSNLSGNLITGNIIMASNLSTNSGQGNVYISANLVVNGNIFSIGGSVGSGSGTSQGVTYVLPSSYSLGTAFATGSAGPGIAGFHINMSLFGAQAIAAVSSFSASSGMLKFTSAGLYSVQCVLVGDQPATKVGIGSTSSATFPPSVTATSGYVYVYNYPLNSSPTTLVTIPLTIQDTSKWYYLDAYFSTVSGSPSVLLQTAPPSGSASGSNYGTYVQVGPFGNYLTSATGVAAGLLCNCSASSNLSGSYSSNAYRVTLTSSNGWTVSGVSTSITAPTANGNFQVNQAGLYEVNMCLNTVGQTPVQFQLGSLANDTLSPGGTTPAYLYTYAPMYTQDPTTTISMPVNITNVSNVYFVEVSFQGTSTANIALNQTSTFVSIKPIGSYVTPSTNPWNVSGSLVYYSNGAVGIGTSGTPTETLTVLGNTSFISNVTVTSDVSGASYVTGKRTPAGSLAVSSYVTGSVPLTTTTNLIQNYLSNAATITANTSTGTITQALWVPGASGANTGVNLGRYNSAMFSNLAASNLFMETWVNLAGVGRFQNIIARSAYAGSSIDFAIYIHSGNYAVFQVSNATATVTAVAGSLGSSAGTWVHLAASYVRTNATQGTLYMFVNGSASSGAPFGAAGGTQPLLTSTSNIYLFHDNAGTSYFSGNVADVRVMTGSVVPVAGFTPQSAPFTTGPTYVTGMNTGYTSNLTLALQSQYFPGASTSPYGPCLTLPGTVGSYYTETGTFLNTSLNSGFTIEAWVNYASFANSNLFANGGFSYMIIKGNPTIQNADWAFGVLTSGQISLNFYNSVTNYSINTAGTITTGSWNHLVAQANTTGYVNMYINGVQQTLQAGGYTGSGTAVALNGTVTAIQNFVTVGQYGGSQGPNFAVAKARVLFGANTYTTTTFTPSPNLGAVPSGATVAWSLDSQYPLPTFPSIQDVTQLSAQTTAYGSLPTPVGGVTSNVVGPFGSSYPQLNSIRFDGTGYIDYGNAASSALTTNLWANAWTIEAWVYPTNLGGGVDHPIVSRATSSSGEFDFYAGVNTGIIGFGYNDGSGTNKYNVGSGAAALNTWTHVAATYDGTRSNVYVGGVLSNSLPITSAAYFPTSNFIVGSFLASPTYLFSGNLADVRVSNVARYTGTSPGAPTQPFASNDANTLLLLKSLAGQTGTTLEVQGRGLNTVSLGATRSVQSYPPAPMSSYLLDTTSNASVTYGQGKYVASASSEYDTTGTYTAWKAFNLGTSGLWLSPTTYSASSPYGYTGSVVTIDTLGTSYAGEWLQLQIPVSVLLSSYTFSRGGSGGLATLIYVLGSRDGINWTLVNVCNQSIYNATTIAVNASQAYNFFRLVFNRVTNLYQYAQVNSLYFSGTEESLCITSDAKVGVGIANPQRALEVAGDLVVSGTISGGAGLGAFRNRIINGDMRIAQRGTSASLTFTNANLGSYLCVDRWQIENQVSSGSITQIQTALVASDTPFQQGFSNTTRITVTSPLTGVTFFGPKQFIEGYNTADLRWGTSFGIPVTVSFWFRSNIPNGSVVCSAIRATSTTYVYPFTIINSGGWQQVVYTVPPPPNGTTVLSNNSASSEIFIGGYSINPVAPNAWSGTWGYHIPGTFTWWQTAGNYIEFTGVQLEKGTVATPFEQRSYATELALCQRYYYQINSAISGLYGSFGFGVQNGFNQVHFATQYPVTMRSNVNSTSNFSNSAMSTFMFNTGGGTPGTLNSFNVLTDSSTPYIGRFYIATGSAGTAGLSIELRANGTTSAFIGFSAEL